MKRFILPILSLFLCLPMQAEEIAIQKSQLPEKSQKIIELAYPGKEIKKAIIEKRASLMQYEVKIAGGVKMQFSKKGALTECTCTKSAVPDVLIPAQIKETVEKQYPKNEIRSIEHDSKLYEIVLDNGDELSFNSSYRLISIDHAQEDEDLK